MKKNFLVFLLIASILLLCSCEKGVGRVIVDDSDKKADARMEQVIKAIKAKDKDTLKSMFSKQALSKADDFEGNLNALFGYIQGDVQSWKSTGGYAGSDEKNADGSGNRKKEVESTYTITTSKQEYHVAIYEYTIDTANPDNIGVYSICIISEKDNPDSEVVYWGNGKAGINIG
nr:DUF5104 domain-containing protein [uncultured Clostridium sp.]